MELRCRQTQSLTEPDTRIQTVHVVNERPGRFAGVIFPGLILNVIVPAHLGGKQNIFSSAKCFGLSDSDDPKGICSQELRATFSCHKYLDQQSVV